MISFVIPAHDEAASIGLTIAAIRDATAALDAASEIVVVDDASTDDTARIAAAAGARVVAASCRQIAAARNAGAAAARGDGLIFVDADTIVNATVVAAAVRALAQGVAGGGADVHFDEPAPRWLRFWSPVFLWLLRQLRLAPGCFFFCRRDSFEAVGGFDTRYYAGEEIILSRALRSRGRFVILREYVTTSSRKARTHTPREIFGTMLRLAFHGHGGLRDQRELALWYGPRRPDTPEEKP
jgi:glycosyltransferase involved in cell wall biosynthesis